MKEKLSLQGCVRNFSLQGAFHATLTKKDGTVAHYHNHNMILDSGFAFIAACMTAETRPPVLSRIAIGLDDTPTQASMTGLGDELASMPTSVTYDSNSKSFTIEAKFGGDVVGAITEAGVCNSEGVFLDRSTFNVMNKETGDELVIRFIISFIEFIE